MIQEQVEAGFRRRDPEHIRKVFDAHAEGRPFLDTKNLLFALKEFDSAANVTAEDVNNAEFLFKSLDRNHDGIIDYDEFVRAVQTPFPVEEWARRLPLAQLLVDALPRREGCDRLRAVGRLSAEEIAAVTAGFAHGLRRILEEHVAQLKRSFASLDEAAEKEDNPQACKFRADVPKLRCGRIDDYHKGVLARIGCHPSETPPPLPLPPARAPPPARSAHLRFPALTRRTIST